MQGGKEEMNNRLDVFRTLSTLGPGLRRRQDTSVTLEEYSSEEEWDMSSGSHSAIRGYPGSEGEQGDDLQLEQDLTGVAHVNRCVICHVDLGDANPRQYCSKSFCPFEDEIQQHAKELNEGTISENLEEQW